MANKSKQDVKPLYINTHLSKELIDRHDLSNNDITIIGEYVTNGFVQWSAYMKGMTKCNESSARCESSKYFAKPNIKLAISDYLDNLISQYKDTLHYQIIDTYRARAFYNIEDILTDQGTLREDLPDHLKCVIDGVEHKPITIGSGDDSEMSVIKKYTLANRDKALEQLTKYMSLISDKIDMTVKNKDAHPVAEELKALREHLAKK